MASQRLGWIDLAKVISICLVTSYHTEPPLTGYAAQFVQLLRMPAFFLIAGFLFDDRKFSSITAFLKHRARQLLIPYCCFEAILIPLTSRSWDEAVQSIENALLGHPSTCIPLWFLICLFGMQVIHFLCIRLLRIHDATLGSRQLYLLLGLYIIVCTLLSPWDITHHFQLNAIVINLPFYAAANCCKELIRSISWHQYLKIAASLIGGLLLVWTKYQWVGNSGSPLSEIAYYLMHLAAGFCLLPPYIACCKLIGKWQKGNRLIQYLGSNTVIILALHTYLIKVLSQLINSLDAGFVLAEHGWLNPCLTLCVVLLHLPIIWIINRWMPWLIGRARQTAVR